MHHFTLGYFRFLAVLLRTFRQGGKLVGILVSNGATAVNKAFRFRSEIFSAPLHFVLLSFSRRASQIIFDAE